MRTPPSHTHTLRHQRHFASPELTGEAAREYRCDIERAPSPRSDWPRKRQRACAFEVSRAGGGFRRRVDRYDGRKSGSAD